MAEPLTPGVPKPSALHLVPLREINLGAAVDYHLHTSYTDGTASARQMADAASRAGISEVLFSEHVRHTSTYFPGFAAEVRSLQVVDVEAYVGAEAKILDLEGTLDCSTEVSDLCDAIVASVHSAPPTDGAPRRWTDMDPGAAIRLELELSLAIVTRSRAHILAHPMGMTITRFRVTPAEELGLIAAACREYGKAFELNPRYCADPSTWIEVVSTADCKVSFGSDAHDTASVGRAWKVFGRSRVNTC